MTNLARGNFRDGKVYKNYVDVDEETAFQPLQKVEDEGIIKAMKWLND